LRPTLGNALSVAATALSSASDSLADTARVARFARGALEFRVRPDDVFISSYPRSGTTWLQYALHLLIHDGDAGFTHISEAAPWYERTLALGTRRAADFERLPSPRIFKSHLPYPWLPRGARYVYAVRDGRDVAVSYHHLYRSHLGSQESFEAFFERFMHGRLQYGSWFEHVASFLAAAAQPDVHVVHYEALSRDLAGELGKLSAFLGLEHGRDRLAELARACSFEAMKRDEHRFDHATEERALRGMQTSAFLRQGRAGDHASYLSDAQRARFEAAARKPARGPRLTRLHAFLH
jgi:hypothetical protein